MVHLPADHPAGVFFVLGNSPGKVYRGTPADVGEWNNEGYAPRVINREEAGLPVKTSDPSDQGSKLSKRRAFIIDLGAFPKAERAAVADVIFFASASSEATCGDPECCGWKVVPSPLRRLPEAKALSERLGRLLQQHAEG